MNEWNDVLDAPQNAIKIFKNECQTRLFYSLELEMNNSRYV